MKKLTDIYYTLYKYYGPQGWWPVIKIQNNIPTLFYHKDDYTYPKTQNQIFEICTGAILTQNTNWNNASKALLNLFNSKNLSPKKIIELPINELALLIKPAGYFNQKAQYIKNFSKFFISLNTNKIPSREELLNIKGIGRETADSMLLYAWNYPVFVVDIYTKRIFSKLGFFDIKEKYDNIRAIFENSLEHNFILYQEYHALIVEHAKNIFTLKKSDFLADYFL